MPFDGILALVAFILGTALGSFTNVLVVRLKVASTLWGRSRCVHCGVPIKVQHLVPILSWFLLQGKCAQCGKAIHPMYPIVEAIGGLLVLIAYARHPDVFASMELQLFALEALFSMVLLVLVTFDFRWQLLPIEFMAGAVVLFGAWNVFGGIQSLGSVAIGIAVGAGFLGAQVWFSRGKWMGSGDPWAGALSGAVLGWPGIGYGLYLTYIIGGFAAVILLLTGVVKRGGRVPFAPLLASGTMGAIWFGPYLSLWLDRALGG
jgi:prepilin signal peptidase PulO-like enzyme (type II secretory pathway)